MDPINTTNVNMNSPHLGPILSIIIPDIRGKKIFGICGRVISN